MQLHARTGWLLPAGSAGYALFKIATCPLPTACRIPCSAACLPAAEDPLLPMGYTADTAIEGKAAAKAELRKRMQLSNAGGRVGMWNGCLV
jgi:hypothetical protein